MDRFETFSLALFHITRYWNRIAAEEMKHYGLKGPHAFYLVTILSHNGQITATQLCELCGKDKADVSRSITGMEQKGLLVRQGTNTYRAKLQLTQSGMEAARRVRQTAAEIVDRVGRDLTPENRAVFYEVLASISANMESITKERYDQP